MDPKSVFFAFLKKLDTFLCYFGVLVNQSLQISQISKSCQRSPRPPSGLMIHSSQKICYTHDSLQQKDTD